MPARVSRVECIKHGVKSDNKFDYFMEFIMLCYPVREVMLWQWVGNADGCGVSLCCHCLRREGPTYKRLDEHVTFHLTPTPAVSNIKFTESSMWHSREACWYGPIWSSIQSPIQLYVQNTVMHWLTCGLNPLHVYLFELLWSGNLYLNCW